MASDSEKGFKKANFYLMNGNLCVSLFIDGGSSVLLISSGFT